MPTTMWHRIKPFLCCGEQEDVEPPALVIGEPFGFTHNKVDLAGLSEQEHDMINSRPVAPTYPINPEITTPTARLDRARAHTRALSNSLKAVTNNAMSSVGPKSSGYSSLANGSTSTVQPLRVEDAGTPHEMKELLPRSAGGPETGSSFTGKGSVETAIAGCEEEDDVARSFVHTK